MRLPTEPGPHWWRAGPDRPWQIAYVEDGVREFRVWEEYPGHPGEWVPYNIQGMEWGEWGERIPGTDRLTAMKEMAEEPIMAEDDCGGSHCAFCGAEPKLISQTPRADGRGYHCEYELTHTPDCPWLRAQPTEEDDAT